jgi:hypothetical protein
MSMSIRKNVKCSITVFLVYATVALAQYQNYPQSNRVYNIGRSIRDSQNVERASFVIGKKYGGINKQLLQPEVELADFSPDHKLKRETGCCDNEVRNVVFLVRNLYIVGCSCHSRKKRRKC